MNEDSFAHRRLMDPPRDIPLAVVAQLLFGGVLGFLGWFFFGFGMIFFWIFAMNSDPTAWITFRGKLETATGTVLGADETSFSEGGSEHTDGTRIYAHRYRFTYQGHAYEGVSYRLGAQAEADGTVTIEFPEGRPQRSRIQGMRSAPFGWPVLFVVVFPLIGALFVLGTLWSGWKRLYLLKYGELAQGKLVDKQPTNTSINDQTVYKLTFAFETSLGQAAQTIVKTHETARLTDDELETLLYDPLNPAVGTTLDHLPGAPRIEEDGRISVRNEGSAYLALVLPALTLVGHGTYAIFRYLL